LEKSMIDQPDSLVSQLAARARARDAEARAHEDRIAGAPTDPATDDILAALAAQDAARIATPLERLPVVTPIAPHAERSGSRSWGKWAAAIVPLAAAAAFAVHLGFSSGPEGAAGDYVVSVAGHIETDRAATDSAASTLEARAGSIQEVVLRPREKVAMPVAARILADFTGGVAVLDIPAEVTDRGVVRFTARGDALRGASEVRVVIAPPAKLEAAIDRAKKGPYAGEPGVTVVRIAVDAGR
jgi:hypothetical protein